MWWGKKEGRVEGRWMERMRGKRNRHEEKGRKRQTTGEGTGCLVFNSMSQIDCG